MQEWFAVLLTVAFIIWVATIVVPVAEFFRKSDLPDPLGFVVPFGAMSCVVLWAALGTGEVARLFT